MTLAKYQALVSVVEQQSFTKAAEQLGVHAVCRQPQCG